MHRSGRYGWADALWTCAFFIVGVVLAVIGWHGAAAVAFLVGAAVGSPGFLRRWVERARVGCWSCFRRERA